jgi:hypothetical protein
MFSFTVLHLFFFPIGEGEGPDLVNHLLSRLTICPGLARTVQGLRIL